MCGDDGEGVGCALQEAISSPINLESQEGLNGLEE
jgi:hypothetical protein